jgi:hypothetical protein
MKASTLLLTALLGLTAALPGMARQKDVTDPALPRSLPDNGGAVSVSWTDPAKFSELKYSGNRWESKRGNWVVTLAEHLRDESAKRLARGQTLQVTITDIERAGRYEPTVRPGLDDIRIVKDIYPPRMTFNFTLKGPDGQVLAEGERKLVDHGFLNGSSISNNDNLRYEKRMIDDWARREFKDTPAVTSTP